MAEGQYWNGTRWVSKDEMIRTRHMSPHRDSRVVKQPPKRPNQEKTDDREQPPSQRG